VAVGLRMIGNDKSWVEAAVRGSRLQVKLADKGARPGKRLDKATLGLPLFSFEIEGRILPEMSKGALGKVLKLQRAHTDVGAHVSQRAVKGRKGWNVLQVTTTEMPDHKARGVVPEPLALFSLADQASLLEEGKRTLVVSSWEDEVQTLMLDGREVVFMRTLKQPGQLLGTLRLSSQAVYLQDERQLLDVDRIYLLGDCESELHNISQVFAAQPCPPVVICGSSKISSQGDPIALGLALLDLRDPVVSGWNVAGGVSQGAASLKRLLTLALPLLLLVLIANGVAEYRMRQSELAGLTGQLAALEPRFQQQGLMERNVTQLQELLNDSGAEYLSPEAWFDIFEALGELRPDGLKVSSIAGKTYDAVIVNGYAEKYEDVNSFLSDLEEDDRFESATLVHTNTRSGKVTFQLRLKMARRTP